MIIVSATWLVLNKFNNTSGKKFQYVKTIKDLEDHPENIIKDQEGPKE